MKRVTAFLTVTTLTLGLASCASRTLLSDQAAYQQYPVLPELHAQLTQGQADDLNVLSPQRFSMASKSYQDALNRGKAGDSKADSLAKQGLATLGEARENAQLATYHLDEVFAARKKALAANADKVTPDVFRQAESGMVNLTGLIEKGKLEEAKAGRSDIAKLYSKAELAALKGNIVDQARDAIAAAKRRDVDDLAPRTMALAQEEFQLALKTLDADRTDTQRAQTHAQKALWNTLRAEHIADMITHFDESDFNEEDKVLWYQQQVANIVAPVVSDASFNLPNKELVKDLNAQLVSILNKNASSMVALERANDRALNMASEKADILTEQKNAAQRDQAIKEKFIAIQSLFSQKEAEVYRQLDNVLIRAYGFNFPSGESEIQGENYILVNKIIEAIHEFPGAAIVVTGHTDDRGSKNMNQLLSGQRAEVVARILAEIGRIPAQKISVQGYGEQQPVASNETAQGRASNRRVEVLIVNPEDFE